MAGSAFFRSRFIEQDHLAVDQPGRLVTSLAAHVAMNASQRKYSSGVVVKF